MAISSPQVQVAVIGPRCDVFITGTQKTDALDSLVIAMPGKLLDDLCSMHDVANTYCVMEFKCRDVLSCLTIMPCKIKPPSGRHS